jgi:hypothetical protein
VWATFSIASTVTSVAAVFWRCAGTSVIIGLEQIDHAESESVDVTVRFVLLIGHLQFWTFKCFHYESEKVCATDRGHNIVDTLIRKKRRALFLCVPWHVCDAPSWLNSPNTTTFSINARSTHQMVMILDQWQAELACAGKICSSLIFHTERSMVLMQALVLKIFLWPILSTGTIAPGFVCKCKINVFWAVILHLGWLAVVSSLWQA